MLTGIHQNTTELEEQLEEARKSLKEMQVKVVHYDKIRDTFHSLQHSHTKFTQQREAVKTKLSSSVPEGDLQGYIQKMKVFRDGANKLISLNERIDASKRNVTGLMAREKELTAHHAKMRMYNEQRDPEQLLTMCRGRHLALRTMLDKELPDALSAARTELQDMTLGDDIDTLVAEAQAEEESLLSELRVAGARVEEFRGQLKEKRQRAMDSGDDNALLVLQNTVASLTTRDRELQEAEAEVKGAIAGIDAELDRKGEGQYTELQYKRARNAADALGATDKQQRQQKAFLQQEAAILNDTREILSELGAELGIHSTPLAGAEAANMQKILTDVEAAVAMKMKDIKAETERRNTKRAELKEFAADVEAEAAVYKAATDGVEAETLRLRKEVAEGERAVGQLEAEAHRITIAQHHDTVKLSLLQGPEYGAVMAGLDDAIRARSEYLREVRGRQRYLKENRGRLEAQKGMFDGLAALLQAKLSTAPSGGLGMEDTLDMALGVGDTQRLMSVAGGM